jgi:hypothetical protein
MLEHNETRRAAEWQVLHDRITKLLDQFGKKDPFGRGDYWLVDDDWGDYRQKLEVQTLSLLQPRVIKLLQAQLAGYSDWEIMFRVDVVGKENEWPAMGLIIHENEIVDDLHREFLPEEFRDLVYEGSKPFVDPFKA